MNPGIPLEPELRATSPVNPSVPNGNRTPAERARHKPPHELRPGLATRHEALAIGEETRVRAKNSVLEPGIDAAVEVAWINQGLADRLPNNRYGINGRTWIDKGDGYTFPESGEGVWLLLAPQLRLLKVLIQEGERTSSADTMVAMDPRLDDALATEVESLLTLIQAHRRRKD